MRGSSAAVFWVEAYMAACHAMLGQREETALRRADVLRKKPDFTLARFEKIFPHTNPDTRARFLDTLRAAGLP